MRSRVAVHAAARRRNRELQRGERCRVDVRRVDVARPPLVVQRDDRRHLGRPGGDVTEGEERHDPEDAGASRRARQLRTKRRCERLVVGLAKSEDIGGELPIVYLNRLSDALFVWGRWCSWKDQQAEQLWDSKST